MNRGSPGRQVSGWDIIFQSALCSVSPLKVQGVANHKDANLFARLRDLELPECSAKEVSILKVSDCSEVFGQLKVLEAKPGEPCALKYELGPTDIGVAGQNGCGRHDELQIQVRNICDQELLGSHMGTIGMSLKIKQSLFHRQSKVSNGYLQNSIVMQDEIADQNVSNCEALSKRHLQSDQTQSGK